MGWPIVGVKREDRAKDKLKLLNLNPRWLHTSRSLPLAAMVLLCFSVKWGEQRSWKSRV